MNDNKFGKHDRTLLAIITQYQTLAMISLGKIQNPATGEVERDLDQARIFIDILEMLKVKCRTDTPDEILRLLDSAVMDLQLNFLDESKKAAANTEEKEAAAEEGADTEEKEAAAEEGAGTGEKEAAADEGPDTRQKEAAAEEGEDESPEGGAET